MELSCPKGEVINWWEGIGLGRQQQFFFIPQLCWSVIDKIVRYFRCPSWFGTRIHYRSTYPSVKWHIRHLTSQAVISKEPQGRWKCWSFSGVQLFGTPWTVPAKPLCPWDFPGKNTGVGSHFLLQGIFPTQGSNPCLLCLLHCQADSFPLSHKESPYFNIRQIAFEVMVG